MESGDDVRQEMPRAERAGSFGRMAKLGVSFAIVLAIGFAGGIAAGAEGASNVFSSLPILGDGLDATPDPEADLTDFWKAWNALERRYVESHATGTPPTAEERIWGAIQGLAATYGDPYTAYLPPQEAEQFRDDISGDFEGVGMELGVKDGVLTVVAPLKGTPADRAGLLAGDQILTIDGASTDGMSTDEAVKLIRGPKGTTVTFTIMRASGISEISVVRDTIQVPTIETQVENGVFVISFYSFTANSPQLFAKALGDFRASGTNLLLIDLRSNPGGYLEAAVRIASHFLPEGAVVVTEDFKGSQENIVHRSYGKGGVPAGTKVAILMDQGSASASEILAGALQDADMATLVGTRSFGKGSVQELIEIGDGALKVTVARWLTPAGQSISEGGLTPDIEAEFVREEAIAGNDTQKERAIRFLTTGQ